VRPAPRACEQDSVPGRAELARESSSDVPCADDADLHVSTSCFKTLFGNGFRLWSFGFFRMINYVGWLNPMQPNLMTETSRLLFLSFRFFIFLNSCL
jgi:hypothetical protein